MSTPDAVVALIDAVRARGANVREIPPPTLEEAHRPWFVSLLLGFAGWLAGFLILIFIASTMKLDSNPAIFGVGAALLAGAWALYYANRNAVFLDQFALAISIAGQCAVAWSLLEDVRSEAAVAGVLLLLQLVILAVMPEKTARTLAALFATIAWTFAVRFTFQDIRAGDFFFGNHHEGRDPDTWRAIIAWLLTWLPMLALTWWLVWREHQWMATPLRALGRPALTGLLLGISLAGIASEPFGMLTLGDEAVGISLGWWAVFPLLSIGLALFAAFCAFRLRSLGLLGFAVFGALLHTARFSYNFGTSLNWKSVIMVCMGVVLLGAGVLLRQRAADEATP